jgi:hypothetical protein
VAVKIVPVNSNDNINEAWTPLTFLRDRFSAVESPHLIAAVIILSSLTFGNSKVQPFVYFEIGMWIVFVEESIPPDVVDCRCCSC